MSDTHVTLFTDDSTVSRTVALSIREVREEHGWRGVPVRPATPVAARPREVSKRVSRTQLLQAYSVPVSAYVYVSSYITH